MTEPTTTADGEEIVGRSSRNGGRLFRDWFRQLQAGPARGEQNA